MPASKYSPTCPSEAELLAQLPGDGKLCVMPAAGCGYVSAACKQGPGPPALGEAREGRCMACAPQFRQRSAARRRMHPASTTPCHRRPRCEQGTFDSAQCVCKCHNEELNAAGYCADPVTKSCTVRCASIVACAAAGERKTGGHPTAVPSADVLAAVCLWRAPLPIYID